MVNKDYDHERTIKLFNEFVRKEFNVLHPEEYIYKDDVLTGFETGKFELYRRVAIFDKDTEMWFEEVIPNINPSQMFENYKEENTKKITSLTNYTPSTLEKELEENPTPINLEGTVNFNRYGEVIKSEGITKWLPGFEEVNQRNPNVQAPKTKKTEQVSMEKYVEIPVKRDTAPTNGYKPKKTTPTTLNV